MTKELVGVAQTPEIPRAPLQTVPVLPPEDLVEEQVIVRFARMLATLLPCRSTIVEELRERSEVRGERSRQDASRGLRCEPRLVCNDEVQADKLGYLMVEVGCP